MKISKTEMNSKIIPMTKKTKYLVPMSSPEISDADRQAVLEVLNTPVLSIGTRIERFEQQFKEYTGCRHAIGVSSGTTGLHLCVRAAGIGAGDVVITTPFSFVSSTNVLLFENAIPIFVDVDEKTGNMDMEQTLQAARDLMQGGERAKHWLPRKGAENKGTLKALLAVDVFGQPADLDALKSIADQHQLKFIEDACEALGAEYKKRKAGTSADYGVFAFYPNKQITTGEGGMIVTNNDRAADLMRSLRNQGRAEGDTWLQHTFLGYNYRMDEMSAALGNSQFTRLEELISKRQKVADAYNKRLAEIPGVTIPAISPDTTRVSWFVYVIHFDKNLDRNRIAADLEKEGIPVRPYFLPIHLQPYMVEKFGYQAGDFPVTEKLGNNGLALPFSSIMSEEQVELVCEKIRACILHN
jgi:perosamine synthetase